MLVVFLHCYPFEQEVAANDYWISFFNTFILGRKHNLLILAMLVFKTKN